VTFRPLEEAVIARAHHDILVCQNTGQIGSLDARETEGKNTVTLMPAMIDSRREVDQRQATQACVEALHKFPEAMLDQLNANTFDEIDGRHQGQYSGSIWCACFHELGKRTSRQLEVRERTFRIHTSSHDGWLQQPTQLRRHPEHADTRHSEHLVPGKGEEV